MPVRSHLFWGVLVVKLLLGTLFASHYLRELFIPFVNYYVLSGYQDPYQHFMAQGRTDLFPYNPLMLYALAVPRQLFAALLPGGVETVSFGHLLVFRLPLLACDLAILSVLLSWFPREKSRVLWLYWCNPLVLYICYWHGQLDIIPTALFLCALRGLRQERYQSAALWLGFALATKAHLLAAAPFFFIYVAQKKGWQSTARYVVIALAVLVVCLFPFVGHPAFRQMVFGTEESRRLLAFRLPVGGDLGQGILLAPLVILLLCVRFFCYPKRNWDLLLVYLNLVFATLVLLVPPRPAYILWSTPFLIAVLCRQPRKYGLPYALLIVGYFLNFLLGPQSDALESLALVAPAWAAQQTSLTHALCGNTLWPSLSFTIFEAGLAGVMLSSYLFGVRSNQVYRDRNRPVLIGLAGDSGSGKDTLTHGIERLIGAEQLEVIAGDDYHKWPRGHESWKTYSHLDVRANNLHQQVEHALALASENTIYKPHYDHATGRFTEEQAVAPKPFILFQGLHSLSLLQLRALYDLRIFLDPQEDVRRLWKVQRDKAERGYSTEQVLAQLDKRAADREKYILAQRELADLIVSWRTLEPLRPGDYNTNPPLCLHVQALNSFNFSGLVELLGATGIGIRHYEPFIDGRWQELELEGTISAEALTELAAQLIPNPDELSASFHFEDGLEGCTQLIFLLCLSSRLKVSQWMTPSH
ncbi:uridine kinase [Armatimonas rosea]|uniref:Phosphoribulokinase n=1 Tax=Armatimonas rosea TaxID=685828 RepID=A0A7W9SL83_ARMRO|nr:uridine kinase [Armatimonas rosea]